MTIRELWEEAIIHKAEDFEVVFAEEGTFVYISNVIYDDMQREVQLS